MPNKRRNRAEPKKKPAERRPKQTSPRKASRPHDDGLLVPVDTPHKDKDRPRLVPVALLRPLRNGRSVSDLRRVLTAAQERLELAWKHRETLDPALPSLPPFHAHAWTALDATRWYAERRGNRSTTGPLVDLRDATEMLRLIVEDTTGPGDPLRRTIRSGEALPEGHALVEFCDELLPTLHSLRGRFPALTPSVLNATSRALESSRVLLHEGAFDVPGHGAQLALDVLLDALDHLRAAARVQWRDRPRLARKLIESLPGED